ncbi:unnamed protein product [Scytosiphon promiscuus]
MARSGSERVETGNPVLANVDSIRSLQEFTGDKQFLFLAAVSRSWREAWGSRAAATSWVTGDSTVPQMMHSFACGLPRNNARLSAAIARVGSLQLLQCAREEGSPWDEGTCAEAAAGGHLAVLRWARENGCPWDRRTCAGAAAGGHLDVLRWARDNGCPQDERSSAAAAGMEYRAVLRWARESGYGWGEPTRAVAAAGGQLAVLQKARLNDGPRAWDWAIGFLAARGGYFPIRKMFECSRANGCAWDETTCAVAAAGAHLAVLLYERQNSGRAWNWVTSAIATRGGHVPVLQWASGSAAWNGAVSPLSARGEYVTVVRWALENGCPCDERTEQWAYGRR